MKKYIKDTEILFILSSYLRHMEVLLITSYCKNGIGFHLIISENPSFYRNKNNEIKREMTSSGEAGGAASIPIILRGYNISLIEIKTYVSTDKILKLSVRVISYR